MPTVSSPVRFASPRSVSGSAAVGRTTFVTSRRRRVVPEVELPDGEELGRLLRAERERREWNVTDTARHFYVSRMTIYRWEDGESRPRGYRARKAVARFLAGK